MAEDRYDWREIQERWLPEWQKLDPFRVGQRGPDAERRYALRYRQPRENPTRVAVEITVTRVLGSAAFTSG